MSKKVLITGGNGGIAQALKQLLEAEAYEVWAPSRSEMDVTNWQSIEAAMQQFTPDILVNNAGFVVPQSVREMDLENT
jgi:dTDP-4-dehydrorhamnose reductase